MLVYRVCNELEARYQREGEPYLIPPYEVREGYLVDKPAVYASWFPEYWRRYFNNEYAIMGYDQRHRYDYTLLLEVPDDVEERHVHRYKGMEFVIKAEQAIVRGVAGPDWPLPDWMPQPQDKRYWDPYARNYSDGSLMRWQPRNGRKIRLDYRQSQEELRAQIRKDLNTIMKYKFFGIQSAPEDTAPVVPSELYQLSDMKRLLGDNLPSRSLLEQYRPSPDWFARPRDVKGIHGINHMTRVLIWQEIVGRLIIQEGSNATVFQVPLRWAAVTHDTQRLDDGADPQHGIRAANWVQKHLADRLSEHDIYITEYLNVWHVPNDRSEQMTVDLVIFKDADALDRVRFGRLNTSYLRSYHSKRLAPLAPMLYQLSEQKHRAGLPLFDCVLAAAVALHLITDD